MKNIGATNKMDVEKSKNLNIEMTEEEIAIKLGISVKEVKEALKSGLSKLKHPRIGKAFKDYLKYN